MDQPTSGASAFHVRPDEQGVSREATCQHCGKTFTYHHLGDPNRMPMQFCSQACRSRAAWDRNAMPYPRRTGPRSRKPTRPPRPPATAPLRERMAWRRKYGGSR